MADRKPDLVDRAREEYEEWRVEQQLVHRRLYNSWETLTDAAQAQFIFGVMRFGGLEVEGETCQ